MGTPRSAARASSRGGASAPPTRTARRCSGGSPVRMRVEHAREHRRHQRRQRDAFGGDQRRKAAGVDAVGQHHAPSRREAARQDRQAADARHRHAREPAVVVLPAQVGGARRGRGQQRRTRQHRAARRAGRAGRVDDHRGAVVRDAPRTRRIRQQRVALGRGEPRMNEQRWNALLQQREQRDDRGDRVAGDQRIRPAIAKIARQRRQFDVDEGGELCEAQRPPVARQRGRAAGLRGRRADGERVVAHAQRSARLTSRLRARGQGRRRNLRKSGGRFSR